MSANTAIFGEALPGIQYIDRPAAYAVILDNDGRVAVVRSKRGWFLPGGGTDPGETPKDTIVREAREEIAQDVTLGEHLGEATQYFSVGEEHRRLLATFYTATLGAPVDAKPEYELEWVSLRGMPFRLLPCLSCMGGGARPSSYA